MDRISRRVDPRELQKDVYTANALQGINDYAPTRAELSAESMATLQQSMQEKQRIETQKVGEYKAARDNAVKAERAFHEAVLGVRDQVRALFGADSDEYQSIGMKKKTEYKSPTRKTVTGT
jgi:hypothetical protein